MHWGRMKTFEPSTYRAPVQCRTSKECWHFYVQCSPITLNVKRKMKLKMNVWLRRYSGLGTNICVQCAVCTAWVWVYGFALCTVQNNITCSWMLNRNYSCARAHHGNEIFLFYFIFVFGCIECHGTFWTKIFFSGYWIHLPFLKMDCIPSGFFTSFFRP